MWPAPLRRYDRGMSFFSILLALLLEQARPLASGNAVHAGMRSWLRWVVRKVDAGEQTHGWLAWGFAVGVPTLIALGVYWLLLALVGWPLAMLWNVAVLYATLGFRQFSHHFTEIRDALEAGDETRARSLLAEWRQIDASELPQREIIRHVIEHSVLAAHRHVFGVLSWFAVLAVLGLGPTGAVLYRLAEFVTRYWPHISKRQAPSVSEAACGAAARAWHVVDWLPARITSLGFAVVGSFEEAIDNWRNYAAMPGASNDGLIVVATAGAISVRLGTTAMAQDEAAQAAAARHEPELAHLRSIVGLVWRSVVMWMGLLALLTLARLIG
jgi:adenosylcobinamide-phosphate synthase